MIYSVLADLVLVGHAAFVVFVMLGGLLVLRWPRGAWVHVPSILWGVWVEVAGKVCPLTPMENELRRAAGESGYPGGFLEHYVTPILYPQGLTRGIEVGLGVAVLLLNLMVYTVVWRRTLRRAQS